MSSVNIGFFAEEVPGKLYFAGREISFPETYFRYAAARCAFCPEVRNTIKHMESTFDDKIGYLDNFIQYGPSWLKDELDSLLSFTMEQLALNGCYRISQDEFFEKYIAIKFDDIPAIYERMEEALNEIRNKQAEKNAERVAERKAKVAAGSDELDEMLWNGVRRGFDGVKNIAAAVDIYNDEIQQKIKDEFIYICRTMVDSFADALFDYEEIDLRDPVSADDYRRTNAMMKNLASNKIPESKIDDAAFEIFSKQPFLPEIIEWAVEKYGDSQGHYQKIADAFHIDIAEKKNYILQVIYAKIDFSTEENLLQGKKMLEAKEQEFNIVIDVFHSKIDTALKEFDLNARTVDGVEYETREKAENAKTLIAFYKNLDFSSEENILKSQKMFLEKEKELNFVLAFLERKISDMVASEDQNARVHNGVEYATREEAEDAKKQTGKLQEMIENCDFASRENVQKLIEEIKSLNFTVPAAEKTVEKLYIRLELLNFIPVNQIDILRLLMIPKVKVVICFILMLVISTLASREHPVMAFIFIVLLVAVIMASRKKILGFSEKFIRQKNFKAAALCSELVQQTKDEFMKNIFDK